MDEETKRVLIQQLPAMITAAGVIVTAYLSYRSNQQSKVNTAKIDEVAQNVNGKMATLLEVTSAAAKAEGILEEKEKQNNEH